MGAAYDGSAHRAAAQVAYSRFDATAQLATGDARRVAVDGDRLTLVGGRTKRLLGKRYDTGSWRSPWVASSFGFDELVASWSAVTSGRSFVEIEVRGRDLAGARSSWDSLARWSKGAKVTRTSFGAQSDDLAEVAVDTWRARAPMSAWQVRVRLARKAGSQAPVYVDQVGAMTSVGSWSGTVSAPGPAAGVVLDVPPYSQMIHRGHSPQWGGGGQAWCSPTSLAMVLGYYGRLPAPPPALAGHVDGWVDDTARRVYDHGYDGAGNWAFNTAYAAPLAGNAFVTRLRSLAEAEQLIAAGIPLVASIAFGRGELTGAPISSTSGHLMVIVGFTPTGDVVVNDPAAPDDASVRRTYSRSQFERLWQEASAGLVYVVADAAHPLPPSLGNW